VIGIQVGDDDRCVLGEEDHKVLRIFFKLVALTASKEIIGNLVEAGRRETVEERLEYCKDAYIGRKLMMYMGHSQGDDVVELSAGGLWLIRLWR
jgi:hypothetical protein